MRRPYGVDVVLLHQADVLPHRGQGDGSARIRMMVMAVDPFQQDRPAINEELPVLYFDGAEAHALRQNLQRLP